MRKDQRNKLETRLKDLEQLRERHVTRVAVVESKIEKIRDKLGLNKPWGS